MTLNEAISLPSLQQKLEEGGYTSMEQLLAGTAKELASGTLFFFFCLFTKVLQLLILLRTLIELGLNFEELKQLIDACDKGVCY